MADPKVVIEGEVKYRDSRKWKTRWCVISKLSPVADCLHLQLYKDAKDRWKHGPTKACLALERPLAMESTFTLDKESHTLALICAEVEVLLAFESKERLMFWQVHIRTHLPETEQFLVQVTHTPGKGGKNSRITTGPARLHLQNKSFSLVTGIPPKVVGHWNIQHLRKYGLVDGRFAFEGGSLSGKGEGLYVLHTNMVRELSAAFDSAASGRLVPNRRPIKKRTETSSCSCWLANQGTCTHNASSGRDSRGRSNFTSGSDGESCDAFSDILRITDRVNVNDDDSSSTRSTTCTQLRWSSSNSDNGTTYLSCASILGDGDEAVVTPTSCNPFCQSNYDVPKNGPSFGPFISDTSSLLSMTLQSTTIDDGHYSCLDVPSFELPKFFDDAPSKLPSSSSTCSSSGSSGGPLMLPPSPCLVEAEGKAVLPAGKAILLNDTHYSSPRQVLSNVRFEKESCSRNDVGRCPPPSHNPGDFYDIPRKVKANL